MAGRGEGPDFVEALARGLDILACFNAERPWLTLTEVATATGLARPTARRLLLTLGELGFIRSTGTRFTLTPRVLRLGMAFVSSLGLWDLARPHLERLVATTGESSSMSQLDGSDIVYVARVSVPKLIGVQVQIGTRYPAAYTALGKVLLSALGPADLRNVLTEPSRSDLPRYPPRGTESFAAELRMISARGWSLADEELALGVRSVAVPVRDGTGQVRAAMNVTAHAVETSVETLTNDYLPLLLRTAGDISADWALHQSRPFVELRRDQLEAAASG